MTSRRRALSDHLSIIVSPPSTPSDPSSDSSYVRLIAESYNRSRISTGPKPDQSNPDSDVSDEHRVLLVTPIVVRYGGDGNKVPATAELTLDVEMAVARTASLRVTDVTPILQLPPFRALLTDEEDKHLDIDNGSPTSDEHTKKYFDFTGEIKKLSESGGSERRSFVEHFAIQSGSPL